MGADAAKTLSGGCLCGAVRFTAVPRHPHVDVCHCGMCRKWSAGPLFALDCGGTVKVENAAELGVYRSSEWAERCFCKVCGTSLFYRLVGKDFYAVSAEAIDDKSGFVFTTQIFIDEKPAYYDFANETKIMTGAEVFAAFSGEAKG
ncbi:MAG: GFA family protein [Pseudorhodoplanes sp.]